MKLFFANNYVQLSDKELIDMIITQPYNEEAAVFLLYNRYNQLLGKSYKDVYKNNTDRFGDCMSDLFEYLRGKNFDWHKLRTFEWKSQFSTWLRTTAYRRFLEIKESEMKVSASTVSIDDDEHPIDITDDGIEEYEARERKVLLLEAIGLLKDPDQKFVVLKRLEGYNSQEIAELMELAWQKHNIIKHDNKGNVIVPSVGYVDVKFSRAKENLKIIIEKIR